MAFKVNAKRQSDGSYLLTYGRGQKQLSARAVPVPDGPGFSLEDCEALVATDTLRNLKERWGEWAIPTYHGESPPEREAATDIDEEESDPAKIADDVRPGLPLPADYAGGGGDCVPPQDLLALVVADEEVDCKLIEHTLRQYALMGEDGNAVDVTSARRAVDAYLYRIGRGRNVDFWRHRETIDNQP